MNIAQALAAASSLGLERLDGQLLLLHALGRQGSERAWLLSHDTEVLDEPLRAKFIHFCERRAEGEPLAYIVGRKEFFGLELQVDARVLVPRPDTEILVEWALELLPCHPGDDNLFPRVVDLGTGSGAIALAIKKHRPTAVVEAVDASAEALDVARSSARRLALDVEFRQAPWLFGTRSAYDLIVSNPPYVAVGDPHLAALKHEPAQALEAGADGLREIRAIVGQAPGRLRPGGWLLLEHGWDQAAAVRTLLEEAGFTAIESRRDLAGIERCSGGRWLELG
jgi:release factor glutamine methyltransferase